MQTVIVIAIVSAAALYVGRAFLRVCSGKGGCTKCPSGTCNRA